MPEFFMVLPLEFNTIDNSGVFFIIRTR